MGSNTWKCISIQIHLCFKNTNTFPTKVFQIQILWKVFQMQIHIFISTAFQTVMLKREMYPGITNTIMYLTKCCWAIIALGLEISFNFLRYSKMPEHTRLGFSSRELRNEVPRYTVLSSSSHRILSECRLNVVHIYCKNYDLLHGAVLLI